MIFQLHPQLQRDCFYVGRFSLSQVLMMNDSQFPWFILVPERDGVTESYQLAVQERACLQEESCFLAQALADIYRADKMNIAAIGNVVPQLHIHHIVRYRTDPVWPAPVWGRLAAVPYSDSARDEAIVKVREAVAALLVD